MNTPRRLAIPVAAVLVVAAAAALVAGSWMRDRSANPRADFWTRLQTLCGHAYAGRLVQGNVGDSTMRNAPLVIHALSCTRTETRVALQVGTDRSRVWVLTRGDSTLQLRHEHRLENGTAEEITNYGGVTRTPGSPRKQEFHTDSYTARLIPAAQSNVWTVEIEPGRRLVYALHRVGTSRRVRLEFALDSAVRAPPPPWGEGSKAPPKP